MLQYTYLKAVNETITRHHNLTTAESFMSHKTILINVFDHLV